MKVMTRFGAAAGQQRRTTLRFESAACDDAALATVESYQFVLVVGL